MYVHSTPHCTFDLEKIECITWYTNYHTCCVANEEPLLEAAWVVGCCGTLTRGFHPFSLRILSTSAIISFSLSVTYFSSPFSLIIPVGFKNSPMKIFVLKLKCSRWRLFTPDFSRYWKNGFNVWCKLNGFSLPLHKSHINQYLNSHCDGYSPWRCLGIVWTFFRMVHSSRRPLGRQIWSILWLLSLVASRISRVVSAPQFQPLHNDPRRCDLHKNKAVFRKI